GLATAPITSQVIERDRHAQYLSTLAIVAASLERVALEVRHLQRTEVRELEEPFGGQQRGSSAMPHKRNPVSSEQICGLARVVRANSTAAMENIALWHERDISHSSVERIILPDSTILVDYMLHRTTEIVRNMKVFPQRMQRNLDSTMGLIFSGQLLQDLVEHGAPREDAYKWVQGHAMSAWESETSFKDRIAADPNIHKFLDEKALAHTFDLKRQLRAVDEIFGRYLMDDSWQSNYLLFGICFDWGRSAQPYFRRKFLVIAIAVDLILFHFKENHAGGGVQLGIRRQPNFVVHHGLLENEIGTLSQRR